MSDKWQKGTAEIYMNWQERLKKLNKDLDELHKIAQTFEHTCIPIHILHLIIFNVILRILICTLCTSKCANTLSRYHP